RHQGEHHQGGGEGGGLRAGVLGEPLAHGRAGLDLGRGSGGGRHRVGDRLVGGARGGGGVDLAVAFGAGELAGGVRLEHHGAAVGQLHVGAEVHQAADGELVLGALGVQHPHPVADPVAGGVGAGGGERDLVRGGGQRPLLGGVAGLALQAQAGGGHAADRAAVLVQQRSVAAEHGAGVGDLVQVAYLLQGLLRQHGRGLLGVGLLGVDPGDGGEPVGGPHHLGAERLLQGAAEDQGPGDEHDAEGDGQGGGGEAGLVQAQAGQGGAEHGFSGLQGEQAVGDGLGGGGVQLVGEAPVAQEHHPVGV